MTGAKYAFNTHGYGTHQAISELVSLDSTVLDVGCASGYLMEYLRRTKNCHCIGVEPDEYMASCASAQDFEVISSTAASAYLTIKPNCRFDHILFGDVLEHLADPLPILESYRSLLDLNGTIIVSLPNVVSLRARIRLVRGIWRYENTGIFDRTHLRFFTVETGKELLADAGLSIINQRFVGPLTFYGGSWFERTTRMRPQILANGMIFAARPMAREQ